MAACVIDLCSSEDEEHNKEQDGPSMQPTLSKRRKLVEHHGGVIYIHSDEEDQAKPVDGANHSDVDDSQAGDVESSQRGDAAAPPGMPSHPAVDNQMGGFSTCVACGTPCSLEEATWLRCDCFGGAPAWHRRCLDVRLEGAVRAKDAALVACPLCKGVPSADELESAGANQENAEALRQIQLTALLKGEGYAHCPREGCSNVIALSSEPPAQHSLPSVGPDGACLSTVDALHMQQYRYRCDACSHDFCASCGATPYHLRLSCAAASAQRKASKCRFCGEVVPPGLADNPSGCICREQECRTRAKQVCLRVLSCGHACNGVAKESKCPPCLHCTNTADDYCNICFCENLSSAPVVQLSCGHTHHLHCLLEKIKAGWPSLRISFGYIQCPICSKEMEHPALEKPLGEAKRLQATVRSAAVQRLKLEGLENAAEIVTAGGRFYKDPEGYSLHRYAFYQCSRCKKPYFGGNAACNVEAAPHEHGRQHAAAQICDACSGAETGKAKECPKHGMAYIEFKCRFCCNVSSFFCFGTTHFCESCHQAWQKPGMAGKIAVKSCTCKLDHPKNSKDASGEFCFGCSICRLQSQQL